MNTTSLASLFVALCLAATLAGIRPSAAHAAETCNPGDYSAQSIKKYCIKGYDVTSDGTLLIRLRFGIATEFKGNIVPAKPGAGTCKITEKSTVKAVDVASPVVKPGDKFMVDADECVMQSIEPLQP